MSTYDKAQCIALGRLMGAIRMAACYGPDWPATELHAQIASLEQLAGEVKAALNEALEKSLKEALSYETEKK
jgi:nitric oxide reductase large subunit